MGKHIKILYVLIILLFVVVAYQQYELKQLQVSGAELSQKLATVEVNVDSNKQALASEINKLKTNMKDFHPAVSQLKVSAEELKKAVEEFFAGHKAQQETR